ncbi:hypothetical protein Bca52824_006474 [Brassica carinata]|uniref:Purple acid phosphatase n=1 Tax=Brassica carinata TaxID=52824 RepID=A0A8X7W5F9_BRACI|nr:hypothetical protein Bca52824_006474 [Brassica carinata]
MMREQIYFVILLLIVVGAIQEVKGHIEKPLSGIAIHKTTFDLNEKAHVKASPTVLGSNGQHSESVLVEFSSPYPSDDDWIGVFSPADFMSSTCPGDNKKSVSRPRACSVPIKFQYANISNPRYNSTGIGSLKLQLINQRSDFSFALFSGGLVNPKLVAVSNKVAFENPNAPVYPRLALGKKWNIMTVTWTSGYGPDMAEPVVEWGIRGGKRKLSPAGTSTFGRNDLCGAPARTVGWRDPGYIHTSFLKGLWPSSTYTYKVGHRLSNGAFIWSKEYRFKSSPFPGQGSLQNVVIFGDMGKAEVDGSNDYNSIQRPSLNTTKQLIKDLKNTDAVFHIGDLCYASGYLSQWDQFTAQIEPIASTVPYMIASGNHERDWPYSGSFYQGVDSGGECGVPAETMFYVPAQNRDKLWYSSDYGMFRFCVADTEQDWREGTDQHRFIEHCFASVDRKKQPWLIFLAHRVLGYSSTSFYAKTGHFAEPFGRVHLEKLWKKYKVDIAVYGHAHNYERTCPVYMSLCTTFGKANYKSPLDGTIHVVAGGGGAHLAEFSKQQPSWSLFRDYDHGYVKLTAVDHSSLVFEYKKSSDGRVHDSFKISREYRDVSACGVGSCPATTHAT